MSKKGSLADPSKLSPIDKKDEEIVRVIIETPSGSRNKYSYDEEERVSPIVSRTSRGWQNLT
jgi:inorganic pyrophosphatase